MLSFFAYFWLKLYEPFGIQEIVIISFFISSDLGLRVNFVSKFFIDILQLTSETMDPHIFADHDPGSQNLADQRIRIQRTDLFVYMLAIAGQTTGQNRLKFLNEPMGVRGLTYIC